MVAHTNTQEYEAFCYLSLQKAETKLLSAKELFPNQTRHFPLLKFVYDKTYDIYSYMPLRKNGDNPFLHPMNLVLYLQSAKITDPLTLCAGILHDYVEEKVDMFEDLMCPSKTKEDSLLVEEYELSVFDELEGELEELAKKYMYSRKDMQTIVDVVKLLTRHKRHFYYSSISCIFSHNERDVKRRAIQIKLADRIHNILSVECFNEENRIYQCFKNLFILNNAKMYLLGEFGSSVFTKSMFSPTERLFNWCGKATYNAFIKISDMTISKGIREMQPIMQLAFKKYVLEREGLSEVTNVDLTETHPMRLYQGIVQKYDKKLHREYDEFKELRKEEIDYFRKFFADFNLNEKQLCAVMDYKDAIALKEFVAQLIYNTSFYNLTFLASNLSKKGRIKIKQRKAISKTFPLFFGK